MILVVITVVMAAGAGLVLAAAVDARVAAVSHEARQLEQGAEAALDLALTSLVRESDLDAVLSGSRVSAFTDGTPGLRAIGGGIEIDLMAETHRLRCGRAAGCSDAQTATTTPSRPWGANNARWQPYVHGRLSALLPAVPSGPVLYLAAWVGDDPLETDGDPVHDAADPAGPGYRIVRVHVEATSAAGRRRAFEALVERCPPGVRVHWWTEVR